METKEKTPRLFIFNGLFKVLNRDGEPLAMASEICIAESEETAKAMTSQAIATVAMTKQGVFMIPVDATVVEVTERVWSEFNRIKDAVVRGDKDIPEPKYWEEGQTTEEAAESPEERANRTRGRYDIN